jgi:hypothetical protein
MAKEKNAKKTTMVLPLPLWKVAKRRALEEDRDLNDIVIAALRLYLKMTRAEDA